MSTIITRKHPVGPHLMVFSGVKHQCRAQQVDLDDGSMWVHIPRTDDYEYDVFDEVILKATAPDKVKTIAKNLGIKVACICIKGGYCYGRHWAV